MNSKLIQSLRTKLDVICAVSGIAVMLVSLVILEVKDFHPLYSVAVIIGIVCVAKYLLLRPWIDTEPELEKGTINKFRIGVFTAVALCLLALAFFVLRSEQYVKPMSYYVLIALSSGALFLSGLYTKNGKQLTIVIIVACCIGLAHIWTENLMFPESLIGIDSWHHNNVVVTEIPSHTTYVDLGITTIGTSYSLLHLYLRTIMDIFPIGYKMASLIFVGSLMTVSTVALVGVIGKRLISYQVGAVAAVIIASANWVIFFSEWVVPNSIGAVLSLAVAYLLLPQTKPSWLKYWVKVPLIAVILIAAYFTHVIVAVWVVGTIGCMSLFYIVSAARKLATRDKRTMADKGKIIVTASLLLLAVVSLPLWLTYTTAGNSVSQTTGGYTFNPSFGLSTAIGTTMPTSATQTETDIIMEEPESADDQMGQNTLAELTFDSLGMILFFGIALFGVLILIRRKDNVVAKLWVLLGLGVLSLGFFPPLFGKSLLEHRWWFFAETILVIPLAVALVSLAKKKAAVVVVSLSVAVLVFISIIGLPSNISNRSLSSNLIVRYAFTDKEMSGADVLAAVHPKTIGTDPLYLNMIMNNSPYNGTIESLEKSLISGDFSTVKADALLVRSAVYEEPFGFGGGVIYKISPKIMDCIKGQGYTETWSNGEVHLLERIKQGAMR